MSEPTGRTIDGSPWEEPRPPHLPDRVTSQSPLVLPFLVVVAYQLWLVWVAQPVEGGLGSRIDYWIGARFELPSIAASLIGLVLFIRHPDARSTLPHLASGAFLLLMQQVMRLLEPTLDPIFIALTPPSDDLSFFSPAAQIYGLLTSVVGVVGLAFLARGLSAARRYENARSIRRFTVALAIVVLVSAGASWFALTGAGVQATPVMTALYALGLVVSAFLGLALSYLLGVSLAGWLGRDQPRLGWGSAAIGAGLILLNRVLTALLWLVAPSQEDLIRVIDLLGTAWVVGWVLLVVAFAMGLPSTASVRDDPDSDPTLDPPVAMPPGSATG